MRRHSSRSLLCQDCPTPSTRHVCSALGCSSPGLAQCRPMGHQTLSLAPANTGPARPCPCSGSMGLREACEDCPGCPSPDLAQCGSMGPQLLPLHQPIKAQTRPCPVAGLWASLPSTPLSRPSTAGLRGALHQACLQPRVSQSRPCPVQVYGAPTPANKPLSRPSIAGLRGASSDSRSSKSVSRAKIYKDALD